MNKVRDPFGACDPVSFMITVGCVTVFRESLLIMCTPGQGSRQPASDHPVSSFSFRTSSGPPFSFFFHFLAPPHSDTGFHLLKQKLTVLLSTRSRASFFLQERWKNKHVYDDTFCRFQIHICKLHYSSAPPPSCWRAYTHTYTQYPIGQACLSASLPTTWWILPRASNRTLGRVVARVKQLHEPMDQTGTLTLSCGHKCV